jgi:hypothetical protein
MLGFAASALSGPTMTFGPDNKGELQLDYKGQFQALVRDTGSGAEWRRKHHGLQLQAQPPGPDGCLRRHLQPVRADRVRRPKRPEHPGLNTSPQRPATHHAGRGAASFDFGDAFKVNVGKFKYGFSRENLEACETRCRWTAHSF